METKAGHRDKASLFRTVPLKAGRLKSRSMLLFPLAFRLCANQLISLCRCDLVFVCMCVCMYVCLLYFAWRINGTTSAIQHSLRGGMHYTAWHMIMVIVLAFLTQETRPLICKVQSTETDTLYAQ